MSNDENLREGSVCPQCKEGHLVLRQSQKGEFLGCSNYPACDFVYHLISQGIVVLKTMSDLCPECGSNLEVKQGRFGIYIGCSNYPLCNYVYQREDDETNIVCPICKKGNIVKRRTSKGRVFYACDNFPSCKFSLQGRPVEKVCAVCSFPLLFLNKTKNGIKEKCPNTTCSSRRRRKQ